MRDFMHKGARVTLQAVTGEVLAAGQSSATTYTMRGGGGYVPPQGGYVAPPKLDSSTIETSNLWLRVDAGVDRYFVLEDARIPLLAGQRVAVIVGNTDGAVADVPIGLLNISSQMWFGLTRSAGLLWVIDRPSKTTSVILTWIVLVLIFLLAALTAIVSGRTDPWHELALWTILLTPALGFVYWAYTRITFAARVGAAHDRLLLQAKDDCRSLLPAVQT